MSVFQYSKFSAQDNARTFPRSLRAVLHASTFASTLPQILVKTPTIPLPFRSRHVTNASVSHLVSAVVIFVFTAAKPEFFRALSNVTLVLTLTGTYLLPGNAQPLMFYLAGWLNLLYSRDPHHFAQHSKSVVNHPASAAAGNPEPRRAQLNLERPSSTTERTPLAEAPPIPTVDLGHRDLDATHTRWWGWSCLGRQYGCR